MSLKDQFPDRSRSIRPIGETRKRITMVRVVLLEVAFAAALAALLLITLSARVIGGSLTGAILDEGLTVRIENELQIPSSSGAPPLARINVLREIPDGSGRLVVNDLRGNLYVIDGGSIHVYFDASVEFPNFTSSPGLGTGLVSFAFHPEFATNGLLYIVHSEIPGATQPNIEPALETEIILHAVLTELRADDPIANTISGTSRELMRVASPHQFHNLERQRNHQWR